LIMSDRFSGKVFPSPSGIASHGKWIAVRQQQLSGALRGAILYYPTRQLSAPRPTYHGRSGGGH
jgi:hypothetical protein